MELDYYYNAAGLDSGDIKALWRYNASTGSGAGPFPTGLGYSGSSFSLFLTYEKLNSGRSVLLSNENSSGNGYYLGFTDNNQLFLECYDSGSRDRYLYDTVNLGSKNCLLIKKFGRDFNIYDYDIVSRRVGSLGSFSASPTTNLGSGEIKVGGQTKYYNSGFFNSFSGKIDQLLLTSEVYNSSDDLTIFSGFCPITGASSTPYYSIQETEDSVTWVSSVEIATSDYAFIKNFYYDLNNQLSGTTGKYVGYLSGVGSGSVIRVSGYFSQRIDECVASGGTFSYSYLDPLYSSTPFTFVDTVNYNFDRVNQLVNHSLLFNNYSGYGTGFYVSHYFHNIWESGTNYSSGGFDSGYYTGFYMNGVSSSNETNTTILMKLGTVEPKYINSIGSLDIINDGFLVDQYSPTPTRVYVAGIEDTGFYMDGSLIKTNLSGDTAIYDGKSSTYTPLLFTLSNFATGSFYKYSSVVLTGENSWSQFYRIGLNSAYKETCPYNLIHGKEAANSTDYDLTYDDDSNYWA
jgi:hypothetical protein